MLFYTSVELTWYMANVMVLAYILFVTYLFFFDSLSTARGASVADALTDESDPQAAADAAAPQAAAGVARTAVGKAKAAPRESSPLLAQSGAAAAEAAEQGDGAPLSSEARPNRCGSASRKLLRLLATPPRYLFAHTIVNAHRRVSCCGTQLMFWPLTLLTCVCYSLGMSYLLVTLVSFLKIYP